jgi:hypothetical protein
MAIATNLRRGTAGAREACRRSAWSIIDGRMSWFHSRFITIGM